MPLSNNYFYTPVSIVRPFDSTSFLVLHPMMLFLLPTKTKKRKCTKEGDEEAQPQKRLEQQTLHQLNTLPSSSLKALSMVFGKEFFNSTYHPQSLMSNSTVSGISNLWRTCRIALSKLALFPRIPFHKHLSSRVDTCFSLSQYSPCS